MNIKSIVIADEADVNGQRNVKISWEDGLLFEYNELFDEPFLKDRAYDVVLGKTPVIRKNVERAEQIKSKLNPIIVPDAPKPSVSVIPEPETLDQIIERLAKQRIIHEKQAEEMRAQQALVEAKVEELKQQGWVPNETSP